MGRLPWLQGFGEGPRRERQGAKQPLEGEGAEEAILKRTLEEGDGFDSFCLSVEIQAVSSCCLLRP